jgi:hypothetical protein
MATKIYRRGTEASETLHRVINFEPLNYLRSTTLAEDAADAPLGSMVLDEDDQLISTY